MALKLKVTLVRSRHQSARSDQKRDDRGPRAARMQQVGRS